MFFKEIREIRKSNKPAAWDYLNSKVIGTPGLESQAEILKTLEKLHKEVENLMTEAERNIANKRLGRIQVLFGVYPVEFLMESQMFFKECIEVQFNKSLF